MTDWSALTDGGAPYLHAVPAACSSYDIDRTTFSVTGHLDGQAYR